MERLPLVGFANRPACPRHMHISSRPAAKPGVQREQRLHVKGKPSNERFYILYLFIQSVKNKIWRQSFTMGESFTLMRELLF